MIVSVQLREWYDQLIMRGVPRSLVAVVVTLALFSAIALCILAVIGLKALFYSWGLDDAAQFLILAVGLIFTTATVITYKSLPSDPRKKKEGE